MTYHITKAIDADFDDAIEKTAAALKEKGFGVLTTIGIVTLTRWHQGSVST